MNTTMHQSRFVYWLNTSVGVRGKQNILAWALAGGVAYYYWWLPEQRKQAEQQAAYEQRRKHYAEKGLLDVDRAKPVPDKQQNGLIVGAAASPPSVVPAVADGKSE